MTAGSDAAHAQRRGATDPPALGASDAPVKEEDQKCQFAADKFFPKEVTQKQATLLPRQDFFTA